jgi:hypothetical protein
MTEDDDLEILELGLPPGGGDIVGSPWKIR